MKKFLFVLMALTCSSAASEWATVEAAQTNEILRYVDAYMVTGNRVILRSGPGKQYPQVRDYDGRGVYFNKGAIMLPGPKGVRNGYRQVYEPNSDECYTGWIAVQYLKKTRWDDGYDY